MWAAVIAFIAAIAPLIIPLLVIWIVTTHWQQIDNALQSVLHFPGIAVGSTIEPLVIGGLVFFGGLIALGVGGYVLEKHYAGERAVPPQIGQITPPAYPASAAVSGATFAPYPYASYTGGGFTGGLGARPGSRPGGGSAGGAGGGRTSRPRSSGGSTGGRTSRAGYDRPTAVQRRDAAQSPVRTSRAA